MKKNYKTGLITLSIIFSCMTNVYAHQGRTDSNGGHRDNRNASGLGSYHYHCGGHPAHLHTNGCPYEAKDSIDISNAPSVLKIGESMKVDCSVTSARSSTQNWTSSDSSVVSVRYDGTLKANNVGQATITVKSYNNSKSFSVEVAPKKVTAIDVQKDNISIQLGKSTSIDAKVSPLDATNQNLNWKSENPSIASVDTIGQVRGLAVGETSITVSSNDGISKTIAIKVYEVLPESIETEVNDFRLEINKTSNIKANVLPVDVNNKAIVFESDNTNVITVDENGQVKAVGLGSAKIKLKTVNNINKEISVEVFEVKAKSISIKPDTKDFIFSKYITVGKTFDLEAIFEPTDATYKDLVWESSDSDVVSVDGNNRFTVHKEGKVILKAKNSEGIIAEFEINAISKGKIGFLVFGIIVVISSGAAYVFRNKIKEKLNRIIKKK